MKRKNEHNYHLLFPLTAVSLAKLQLTNITYPTISKLNIVFMNKNSIHLSHQSALPTCVSIREEETAVGVQIKRLPISYTSQYLKVT